VESCKLGDERMTRRPIMGTGVPRITMSTVVEVQTLLRDLRSKKSLVNRMSEKTYNRILQAESKLSQVAYEAITGRAE
jgi:hypothetical protein